MYFKKMPSLLISVTALMMAILLLPMAENGVVPVDQKENVALQQAENGTTYGWWSKGCLVFGLFACATKGNCDYCGKDELGAWKCGWKCSFGVFHSECCLE